ncbi:MAG: heme o synthase [Trueperaceae bacterium]|nr:heme o synthase [Trueperaceae bacterium]
MSTRDAAPVHPPRATWRDYLTLTKPRVISLLLLTTIGAMFIAARGWPGTWPLIGLLLGGYMSAGAAGVFNMIFDRDIDERMRRTAKRPTVTQVVPTPHATVFAIALTLASFTVIWAASNLLAALLSWAGIAFYVIIYTMWLKRTTWQNIVIGGAAGAIPPLVGWAAVTGELSLLAWLLFALVFLWTPVHFWALALMIKDEYAAVGVPMAPSVIGERATVLQIVMYAVLTIVLSVIPFAMHAFSPVYFVAALGLNVVLALRVVALWNQARAGVRIDKARALPLYKYSMLYLALLFLTMAVDRAFFA